VQIAVSAIELTPSPQAPVAAALPTLLGTAHDVGAGAGVGAASGSQVKVSKSLEPLGHAGLAMLGVNPESQAGVQLSPSAIEITPTPQCPVEAALATPVGTAHAETESWQVKVGMDPAVHVMGEVMSGVKPEMQSGVQVSPSAIEVTPSPQAPVEAVLSTPVGTAHAVLAVWQAKGSKVPAEQVTWALLAVNVSAQVTVHSAPWAVSPPPPQAPDACALATVEVVGSVHAFGVQVKPGKTPPVGGHVGLASLGVYPLSQAAVQSELA
jgi:hypothetical protein